MHIGVIGINHRSAPLQLRETIAKACARRFSLENPLSNASFVLLSTCNRSELYFCSESLSFHHEQILSILKDEVAYDFDQKLYTFFGYDCFLHLAKVTSGLDSAIVAETEIQGQVKNAYEQAGKLRVLSKDLHFLFQKSLKIAKEIRRDHLSELHLPDLEHAIYWQAKEHFQNRLPSPLFIGASQINCKIAQFLRHKGINDIYFCSRACQSIKGLDVHFVPLEKIDAFPWIISATKSPNYIIRKDMLKTDNPLLIDLAVPRNIDPSVDCKLLNIDDLNLLLEKRLALIKERVDSADQKLNLAVRRSLAIFRNKSSLLPFAISA